MSTSTGEQVVADLDAVLEHVVEEERAGDPLADRSALHVGEGHHHGVDVASIGCWWGSVSRVSMACTLAQRAAPPSSARYSGVT